MGHACLEIAEVITSLFELESFQDGLRTALSGDAALDLVGQSLTEPDRAIWNAERDAMPPGVMPQFAHALRTAAENGLAFRFESTPPDDVMGFARDRAIDVSFRYSETEIVARIAHTTRHPSWLADRVGVPS